jgi:hypothetical protein
MKYTQIALLALTLATPAFSGQPLSMKEAVTLAEKFIAENGYTNLPPSKLKAKLDLEFISAATSHSEVIKERFNKLLPKAIGAYSGGKVTSSGWSVAFDYRGTTPSDTAPCRVVTMASDGSNIKIQHQEGIRKYFVGFQE